MPSVMRQLMASIHQLLGFADATPETTHIYPERSNVTPETWEPGYRSVKPHIDRNPVMEARLQALNEWKTRVTAGDKDSGAEGLHGSIRPMQCMVYLSERPPGPDGGSLGFSVDSNHLVDAMYWDAEAPIVGRNPRIPTTLVCPGKNIEVLFVIVYACDMLSHYPCQMHCPCGNKKRSGERSNCWCLTYRKAHDVIHSRFVYSGAAPGRAMFWLPTTVHMGARSNSAEPQGPRISTYVSCVPTVGVPRNLAFIKHSWKTLCNGKVATGPAGTKSTGASALPDHIRDALGANL